MQNAVLQHQRLSTAALCSRQTSQRTKVQISAKRININKRRQIALHEVSLQQISALSSNGSKPTVLEVEVESENGSKSPSLNGNGASLNGNGASLNGNGASSNGNGALSSAAEEASNGVSNGSSNGAANGASISSTTAKVLKNAVKAQSDTESDSDFDVKTFADPCAQGQVETCAASFESEGGDSTQTDSKTPYSSPGGRWNKVKNYSTFRRTLEIWSFVFVFAIKYLLLNQKWTYGKTGMTPPAVSARKRSLAIWLRESLIKLGPTFIKIGQQFSTRVDILAPEFIQELEKLQDNVPPFDSQYAREIIEGELEAPVDSVFTEFNNTPVAAASLGQVHLAKYKGEKVVVKVQRPGLKELFDIDLKNIRKIAQWLQAVDPKTDGAARDWVAIYDECSRILYEEIDYEIEARNATEFAKNFKGVSWVKVPKVIDEVSKSKVLVMEYVPGTKVNNAKAIDAMGLDRNTLARYTVEAYLLQLLKHGFFHADPHPGNVAVDATGGGRLIYYDFGMMGRIPGNVREGLYDLFFGVYDKDPDKCLDSLVQMGVLVDVQDKTAIRRTAAFFLEQFETRLKEQKQAAKENPEQYSSSYKEQRTKEEKKAVRKKILSNIGEDLLLTAADQPFRFPATFTFVVRAFTVLDGIGKSLNPRFDISEIAGPYARDFLLDGRPAFDKIQKNFQKKLSIQNRAVGNLFTSPNRIQDMSDVIQRMERGDLKLRVRALEAERALVRVQAWQPVMGSTVVAACLVNIGTVLQVSAMQLQATATFAASVLFAMIAAINYLKIKKLEQKEAALTA